MKAVDEIRAKIEATNKEINKMWDELDKWPKPSSTSRKMIEADIEQLRAKRRVLRDQLREAMLDEDDA